MQLIHFFNILSILSITALAAPATSENNSTLSARTNSYRQSCTVNYQGGYWTAPVSVGGQTKQCKVSTGAADVLIMDNSFSSYVRGKASSSSGGLGGFLGGLLGNILGGFQQRSGAKWGFTFGHGINLSGSVYSSAVTCGGLAVKAMNFGCLSKTTSYTSGLGFQGVLGLGFKGVSAIQPATQGSYLQQSSASSVGCVLRSSNPYIEFGAGIDTSVYTGSLVSLDIDASAGLWSAGGFSFSSKGKGLGNGGYSASFDTSASVCSFHHDVAAAYWGQCAGAVDLSANKDGSKWAYPCSSASLLPAFEISAGVSGSLSIPGAYLASGASVGVTLGGKGMCLGGLQGGVSADAGVLGFPFFASNYAHFDQDNLSVSCAAYKGQSAPASGYGCAGLGGSVSAK